MRRREIRGTEKRNKGCGEEKTLYFGATVLLCSVSRLGMSIKPILHYTFLACVGEENARNFALGKLKGTFF